VKTLNIHSVLVALLVMALLGLTAVPVTAQGSPRATGLVPASTPIPCSESPFGGVMELGREREIFLGFRDTESATGESLGAYRFDLEEASGRILEQELFTDSAGSRSSVSWLAGVAADLDGDGRAEFVQGFTDAGGKTQFLVHRNGSSPVATLAPEESDQSYRAMAAGDLLDKDDGSQQVVVASRGADGVLTVSIWDGAASGGLGQQEAVWRSTAENRGNATQLALAVGNLDNDGYADVALAFIQADGETVQLVFLEYDPDYSQGSGANYAYRLRVRTFITTGVSGAPTRLQVALADLNGDNQDSLVLASDTVQANTPGISPVLRVSVFDFDPKTGVMAPTYQWTGDANALDFALAVGDLDGLQEGNGNRRQEILLGYDSAGIAGQYAGLNIHTLRLVGLETSTPSLVSTHRWWDGSDGRGRARYLALAVDDLDRDNRDDVVAAFQDENPLGFQMVHLAEQFDPQGQPTGLQLMGVGRFDATLDSPIQLAMGDWDKDSLRAFAAGVCARVVEHQITGVGFIPPFWRNIQGNEIFMGGSMGRSVTAEAGTEESLTYLRSHTVSAFAGVSLGFNLADVAGVGASARAVGAREYASSNKRTTSTITSTVTTVGRSWGDDSLVYEAAEYRCYSYQVADGETVLPVDEASVRFCEYQPLDGTVPLVATRLDSWDVNLRTETEWTPVVRDWSSLALFRGGYTAQSSNQATAPLAVDSRIVAGSFISGTLAQTDAQDNPWWQVDLGSVLDIDKIRIWSPDSYTNLHVFVSNQDFRDMAGQEDPANLVGAPGVRHYTLADLGLGLSASDPTGRVTTFLTRDSNGPIQGRYVRVQWAGQGVLRLAEVQVFGPNHLEPDRYPLDLRDETPDDGAFQVLLYNPYHAGDDDKYQWVQTRGNLLWDGRQNSVLNGLLVDRGNASVDWSLSKETVTTRVQAEELTNQTSIGYEFDLEAGIVAQAQAGYGETYTAGVGYESVQSTAWGSSFDMGGQMAGFPLAYDGPEMDWVLACRYRFQPYYYEIQEESSLGYRHRFPVLDYLVPDDNRASDLDREADLAACRNGSLPAETPQPTDDQVSARMGESTTLHVLANDRGNGLQIVAVSKAQNGVTSYDRRTVTYTPNPGFLGTDSFDYTVSDGVVSRSATVTVTVLGPARIYLPTVSR